MQDCLKILCLPERSPLESIFLYEASNLEVLIVTAQTAGDICNRFTAEREYIQRFVDFLWQKSAVHDEDVWELGSILKRNGLARFERETPDQDRVYTHAELAKLIESIQTISPNVERAIADQEERFELVEKPDVQASTAQHRLLGEWIDYMVGVMVAHQEEGDEEIESFPTLIENLRRRALAQQEEDGRESGENEVNPDLIDNAIRWAVYNKAKRKLNTLYFVKARFDELQLVSRVTTPNAEINIRRQGFILLMTAFDAATFDLVRVTLRDKFFALIGSFGRQEKVSLERLGSFDNFEAFRDQIIEEQLKIRYLKDLLFLLNGLGVSCVDDSSGDRFADLVELVLRRNVHVHNRGLVDERYLERDQKGQPQFNLFGLSVGDVAPIDDSYWERAVRLSQNCVALIAAWAERKGSA